MRLLAPTIVVLVLAACTPTGPRTLVYAFDEGEPTGRLDRETCIVGAGLRLPLGPSESVAFDISADQRTALLATCDLEGSSVLSCGTLTPEIPLEIEENVVTGIGSVPVEFTDTDCTGADLESTWTMTLDDTEEHLDSTVEAVWNLHDTPECDLFEAEVLAAFEGNGRIDGCVVNFGFTASLVADCRVIDGNTLDCD